jgi:ubiquinone/menaquinone biosynthesis C-methylase UbiE
MQMPGGKGKYNDMNKYLQVNRKLWDEKAQLHFGSEFYDLAGFTAGKSSLYPIEQEEIGKLVSGKTMLHLQCHFGLDTFTWARLGAVPTGVDFSSQAISQARVLQEELGLPVRFIEANIYDLPHHLNEQFEIVYTSYGVLAWLPDIRTWGQLIARYLKPGGFFYMVELHPFSMILDDAKNNTLKVGYPYFHNPEPFEFKVEGTYAVLDAEMKAEVQYEWAHTIGDILNALINAGLEIEYLHEFDYTVFQHFSILQKQGRLYVLPEGAPQIPLLFSLKAQKLDKKG